LYISSARASWSAVIGTSGNGAAAPQRQQLYRQHVQRHVFADNHVEPADAAIEQAARRGHQPDAGVSHVAREELQTGVRRFPEIHGQRNGIGRAGIQPRHDFIALAARPDGGRGRPIQTDGRTDPVGLLFAGTMR
jgi:hypothetical protein